MYLSEFILFKNCFGFLSLSLMGIFGDDTAALSRHPCARSLLLCVSLSNQPEPWERPEQEEELGNPCPYRPLTWLFEPSLYKLWDEQPVNEASSPTIRIVLFIVRDPFLNCGRSNSQYL